MPAKRGTTLYEINESPPIIFDAMLCAIRQPDDIDATDSCERHFAPAALTGCDSDLLENCPLGRNRPLLAAPGRFCGRMGS